MSFILRILAGSLGPYLLGALGLLSILGPIGSGFYFHHKGYHEGVMDERASWQSVANKAKDAAITLAEERQARTDDAATAKAERDKLYDLKVQPIHDEVIRYVKEPIASERCLADDGVRIGQSAIDAANRSIAGSGAVNR